MARDSFPKRVVELTFKRVAGRCSNPSCRTQTIGPSAEPLAVVNTGVAAHIFAASPGGPRYRSDMSSNDRRAFGNAIWLCASCATRIDRDTVSYSAELLFGWKKDAEERARAEQGTRLPESSDGYDQIAMALAGAGQKFLPQAVHNVHKAAAASLSSLDPRFDVKSEFSGGAAHFSIRARENVSIAINVGPESAGTWAAGVTTLLDRGLPVKLPMQGVSFEGSKLFNTMLEGAEQGTLTISPSSRPAVVKLFVPYEDAVTSEDINGTFAVGRRALHFEGSGYGGLINLELDLNRLANDKIGANFKLTPSLYIWQGLDARNPPYLDKVLRFLECLVNSPDGFRLHLEVDGNRVSSGENIQGEDKTALGEYLNFLYYVKRARTLTRYLNISLPIDVKESFSLEDHKQLAAAANVIQGRSRYVRSQIDADLLVTIVCVDEGRELMAAIEAGEFTSLQQRSEGSLIKIFGKQVQLPPTVLNLSPVRLHLVSKQTVLGGVEFQVRAEMAEDFVYEVVVDSPTEAA